MSAAHQAEACAFHALVAEMTVTTPLSPAAAERLIKAHERAVVDLIAAGDRVTEAFRALGLDNSLVNRSRLARECEAAMLAFDAALARAKAGGA